MPSYFSTTYIWCWPLFWFGLFSLSHVWTRNIWGTNLDNCAWWPWFVDLEVWEDLLLPIILGMVDFGISSPTSVLRSMMQQLTFSVNFSVELSLSEFHQIKRLRVLWALCFRILWRLGCLRRSWLQVHIETSGSAQISSILSHHLKIIPVMRFTLSLCHKVTSYLSLYSDKHISTANQYSSTVLRLGVSQRLSALSLVS